MVDNQLKIRLPADVSLSRTGMNGIFVVDSNACRCENAMHFQMHLIDFE
jgi:hypothetical protein